MVSQRSRAMGAEAETAAAWLAALETTGSRLYGSLGGGITAAPPTPPEVTDGACRDKPVHFKPRFGVVSP